MKTLVGISKEVSDFLLLIKEKIEPMIEERENTKCLYKALKVLDTEDKVFPKTFINVFGNNELNSSLELFLKTFHEKTYCNSLTCKNKDNLVLSKSLKSTKKFLKFKSLGSQLFHSQIHEIHECGECEYKAHYFNEDFTLDTKIIKDHPVDFKLKMYLNDKDYIYTECENCGKSEVDVEHIVYRRFSKLPYFLIIKKNNSTEYPEFLDLSGYSEMCCNEVLFKFLGETCDYFIYKKNAV